MTNARSTHFFLGANSPIGFYSLYNHLLDLSEADDIMILKGGPGCGKSLFMFLIAEKLSEAGVKTEYLHCCNDPDCLDAVVFPELKTAIADGTAPHVLEPVYPGAIERYVNLDAFYDIPALKARRTEIMRITSSYQISNARALRYFAAAKSVCDEMRSIVLTDDAVAKIAKRTRGIINREFKKNHGKTAKTTKRFLGGATSAGTLCRFDTVRTLCDRVYELMDEYGLADFMLSALQNAALSAGYDVIACPSPIAPDRLAHLFIPALSLGFITSTSALPYDGYPYRRIRLDAILDGELLRRNRTRLRFSKKISTALTDEGLLCLAQSKAIYDSLETIYTPHVRLDGVFALADQIGKELLEKWNLPKENV